MFYLLSKTLDVALSPLTWILLGVALAVPWSKRRARDYRRRRKFGGAALALALVASNERVADALAGAAEGRELGSYDPAVTYDVVVMLGGVVDASATRSRPGYNDNVERMLVTYDLLRTDRARYAILSGGDVNPGRPGLTEAEVVGAQLVSWGIAKERVIEEPRARNTRENAVFVAQMVKARGLSRVLVVTSAFHMPRSLDCFRAVGLSVDALPVDHRYRGWASSELLPRADALSRTTTLVREVAGRSIYRLQGYGRGPG